MSLAVPAEPDPNQSLSALTPMDRAVIRALASGKHKNSVAKALAKRDGVTKTTALRRIQRLLARVENRDLLWEQALAEVDARAPAIVHGVAKKGEKGRVDAAKLALELVGRYNPRPDAQVNVPVVVQFGVDLPRPSNRHTLEGEAIEVEE